MKEREKVSRDSERRKDLGKEERKKKCPERKKERREEWRRDPREPEAKSKDL